MGAWPLRHTINITNIIIIRTICNCSTTMSKQRWHIAPPYSCSNNILLITRNSDSSDNNNNKKLPALQNSKHSSR